MYTGVGITFHIPGSGTTVVGPVIDDSSIVDDGSMLINVYTAATVNIIPVHIRTVDILAGYKRPVVNWYIITGTNHHSGA